LRLRAGTFVDVHETLSHWSSRIERRARWTVAAYLIEGGSSSERSAAQPLYMFHRPLEFGLVAVSSGAAPSLVAAVVVPLLT
jgi:hypothetical protein